MSHESVVESSIRAPGPLDRVLLESLPLSPSRLEVCQRVSRHCRWPRLHLGWELGDRASPALGREASQYRG